MLTPFMMKQAMYNSIETNTLLVSADIVTDRTHTNVSTDIFYCGTSLRCLCPCSAVVWCLCAVSMRVYLPHSLSEIMHMCVFIHMHVPVSITVFVSPPVFALTSRINISLSACHGDGTHLSQRGNEGWDKWGGKRSPLSVEDEGVNTVMQWAYGRGIL